MADNKNIMDKLAGAPKWLIILVAAVVICILAFFIVWFGFGLNKEEVEEKPEIVLPELQDATVGDDNTTLMDAYRNYRQNQGKGRTDDYWASLGGSDLVGSGVDNDPTKEAKPGDEDYLDPSVYSEQEIMMIRSGKISRSAVDRQKANLKSLSEVGTKTQSSSYGSSSKNADSAYYERMERAFEIAMRYQQPAAASAPVPDASSSVPDEEEERRIELEEPSVLPTDALADDGIISSLDYPSDAELVRSGGRPGIKPVKATFLKTEKIANGQRVIIRLMQDLTLSDGTLIPANTHITGTCSFNKRLKINVTMLHYGGRMFPTDLSVYDNDGTEGIYCPLVGENEKKSKKAARVAGDVVQSAGTIAGTLLTGNPFMGRMATSGLQAVTGSIGDDGSVSVNVTSGYEFYVYENIKEDKNGR